MITLSAAGATFAVACMIFNFMHRKKRLVYRFVTMRMTGIGYEWTKYLGEFDWGGIEVWGMV